MLLCKINFWETKISFQRWCDSRLILGNLRLTMVTDVDKWQFTTKTIRNFKFRNIAVTCKVFDDSCEEQTRAGAVENLCLQTDRKFMKEIFLVWLVLAVNLRLRSNPFNCSWEKFSIQEGQETLISSLNIPFDHFFVWNVWS